MVQSARSNRDKEKDRDRRERDKPEKPAPEVTSDLPITEKELQGIKGRYLGEGKKKKKVVKMSDKFRFAFDWELGEDTSKDVNPLYDKKHDAQLLFGRGLRAGIDMREQKKNSTYVEQMESVRAKIQEQSAQQHEGMEVEEREEWLAEQRRMEEEERRRMEEAYASRAKAGTDRTMKLPGRHWQEKQVWEMSIRDWRIFREDFEITTRGGRVPNPIRNWAESGLPEEILRAVAEKGYKMPSPIQMQCIPLGLNNRDVVGVAQTGSGKTAAFVLPMLVYISKQAKITPENAGEGPQALVLAPSRELANQIYDESVTFCKHMGMRCFALIGGGGVKSIEEQGFAIRQGVEVIIATPGRLIDTLERRLCVLNQCNYIVLDEADRMIDMGFEPQVQQILDAMPAGAMKPDEEDAEAGNTDFKFRQTFMFSATMPPAVERITRKYLRRPVYVTVGEAGQTANTVTQNFSFCSESQKKDRLLDMLRREKPPIMVFVNARKVADTLYRDLAKQGFKATVLHAGRTQEAREQALDDFKDGVADILVCTDVAGRGIDISGVEHVINFDCPKNIEDYTHRIGRTGRAGKTGVATTMLTPEDTHIYYDLREKLQDQDQPVPREILAHPASKEKPGAAPAKAARPTIQYLRD